MTNNEYAIKIEPIKFSDGLSDTKVFVLFPKTIGKEEWYKI